MTAEETWGSTTAVAGHALAEHGAQGRFAPGVLEWNVVEDGPSRDSEEPVASACRSG